MDAATWVAIITAIGTSTGAIVISVVTMILAYMRDVRNMKVMERVERTGTETHALVNSASLATQRLLAVALRRIAVVDPTEDNINAAEAMEKQVKEHEERQQIVDDKLKEQ